MKKIYVVIDENGDKIAFGSRRSAESYQLRHPESIDEEIEVVPFYETYTLYQEEDD